MAKVIVYLLIVGVFVFLVSGVAAAMGSQVKPEVAISAMTSAGFTNVTIVNSDVWLISLKGCGGEDNAKFDMLATNPQGEVVSNAYVCVGWPFKGATIRYR